MLDRLLGREPIRIAGYRSYGTPGRLRLLCRVLEDESHRPARATHSRWRNFREALKRFDADPLPHARVRATYGGTSVELRADDEGFIDAWVELPSPLPLTGWHQVPLELLDGRHPGVAGVAHVLVPASGARFGIISDLDDTVLQSSVATPWQAARLMLFENARTRLPFRGVAAFYRALVAGEAGEGNPLFYVSSSPWNVHDLLVDFLDAQGIPLGPLLLRDWDIAPSLVRNAGHKHEIIEAVLESYPALPFILVGDTSQEDPEIYAAVVERHPGRVLAIYIRDVGADDARRDAVARLTDAVLGRGVPLVLAPDTLDAARHAAERGWIDAAQLADIGEEKREDDGVVPGKVPPPAPGRG